MKDILRKIHLIDNFTIELEIDKNDFFQILQFKVDEKRSDFFDAFTSSMNEYKGIVTQDNFEIKRIRRFFDMNMNFAKAKGTIKQNGSKLIIETEINAFYGQVLVLYVFLIVFYSIFLITISTSNHIEGNTPGFALPFILIHALFMFGIPYFMMRQSVTKMKYELERDLYFMIKK